MFRSLLIANRGEIARRIGTVARAMGLRTIAVYSDADAQAPFVKEADQAVRLGPPPPKDSYLNVEALIRAAKETRAEAVHPGYGFVSENAEFARACTEAGIVFVGPPPESMARMKDKAQARALAAGAGVPVVPGSDGVVADLRGATEAAERIGFPLLVKAAGGGGGIGMAVAGSQPELEKAFRACADRARSAFGRDAVYLERYFPAPRHIEVQILGDTQGNLLHVLERECSIQRRHQKLLEESPSTQMTPELRAEIGGILSTTLSKLGYVNAGTIEFLMDQNRNLYFIEMNTRIQVEHPVTEMVTDVDLVKSQILLAMGERMETVLHGPIVHRGHTIECRINAEHPEKFTPSAGKITAFHPPGGTGVRIDTAAYAEGVIPPYYDSLIAKLVVRGKDRDEAMSRMSRALEMFIVEGIHTTIPLHRKILADPDFRAGKVDTTFIERFLAAGKPAAK